MSDFTEEDFFALEFTFSVHIFDHESAYDEPDTYVRPIKASIVLNDEDPKLAVGSMDLYVLELDNALEAGVNWFDVIDCNDQSIYEHASAAIDGGGDWKPWIKKNFEIVSVHRMLILEKVIIDAAHRGHNLGLLASRRAIDVFGGASSFVIVKPYPLQFGESGHVPSIPLVRKDEFPGDLRTAKKKLVEYWSRLGFRRIARSDYYGLSTCEVQPSTSKMLKTAENAH